MYRIAYSQKLQHFFSAIGKDFFKHQSAVFVRDFYDLLERSSFDVDLLYRHSSKKKYKTTCPRSRPSSDCF